jgi:hypothetical protein
MSDNPSPWALLSSQVWTYQGVFAHDVKSVLSENLGGILGGTECQMCLIA